MGTRWLRDESITAVKSNVSFYCWPGRLTFVMTWYSLYFRSKIGAETRPSQVMLLVVLQMASSISSYAQRVMWGYSLAWMNSLHVYFLVLSLCIVWHCSQVPKLFSDGFTVPCLHCTQVYMYSNVLTPITCAACRAVVEVERILCTPPISSSKCVLSACWIGMKDQYPVSPHHPPTASVEQPRCDRQWSPLVWSSLFQL